ncbi:MAG: hypothetical protein FJZ00_02450, partial [Candidatus Sericytochromatia bacterium]|nr:hypothetical protein [Candidatus Tanganyikabacteria bacterium]
HNDSLPALDWYLMPEAYSAPLVEQAFAEYGLKRGDVVLDPFSGTGTTVVVAKLHGLRGWGVEANPFLAWAARTKLAVETHPEAFDTARERVLDRIGDLSDAPEFELPDMPRVETWITPEIAYKVIALRTAIEAERPGVVRDLLRLALAAILRPVGNLKLTAHAFGSVQTKADAPVRDLFEARTAKMVCDLAEIHAGYAIGNWDAGRSTSDRRPLGSAAVTLGDARQLAGAEAPFGTVDLAITSPPYLNNLDYTMQTRLELFFLGHVAHLTDIRAIRKTMVVCDAKAMYKDIHDHELIRSFKPVQDIADAIAERHAGKNWGWDYPFMTRQYFGGLFRVLKGAKTHLKRGARFVLVVGESSHSGVKVPVPALLGELGESLGYTLENICVHRIRRSSSHGHALEEASVVLKA